MPDENPVALAASGRDRLKALGRLLAYLGVAVGLTAVAFTLAKALFKLQIDVDSTSQTYVILGSLALLLLTVVVPTGLLVAFTKAPATAFGWGVRHRGRQLLWGLWGGLGLMALLMGLIALSGGAVIAQSPLAAASVTRYGLGYAVVFALTALSQEGLLHGYILVQLSRALSFWPAALITSLLFGALHLGHRGETLLGLVQVALFGLLMAFSVLRSGALWFALGFHAAWDFAETFLFGVPDSGVASAGSLLTAQVHGPAWLTGGPTGPEGSLLVLPVLALGGVIIQFALRGPQPPTDLGNAG